MTPHPHRWLARTIRLAAGLLLALAAPKAVMAALGPEGIVLTNISALPNGGVRLEAMGANGVVYGLQVSLDLDHWRVIDFTNIQSGPATFIDNSAAGPGPRFYRVRTDAPATSAWLTNYHGWSNSIILSNGKVEAAIVPAIGRVMQFRFSDALDGPFWENSSMFGKTPTANAWNTTGSFGGDKAWPAPQSVWNWPPPRGFDSMSFTGAVEKSTVTLTGPVDTAFGTRVVRTIDLHPVEPLLRISSRFEKMTGRTNQVSVWIVTQVKEAERVFLPVPDRSFFPKGYTALGAVPAGLVSTNGLVSLRRDPNTGTKIGNDAGAILWVGADAALLIESARIPGIPTSGYPDTGCSAEVYTNPNPVPYIEMELLGPLAVLGLDETLEAKSVYTLFRRTQAAPMDEARRIFGR